MRQVTSWEFFAYLVQSVGEFLLAFSIITLPLVIAIVVLFIQPGGGWRRWVACLTPGLIPLLILWIGVAFVRGERTGRGPGVSPPVAWFEGRPEQFLLDSIGVLLFLHLPLAAILVWFNKGSRWAIAMSSISWAWVSVFAAVLAEMSFTGNWL